MFLARYGCSRHIRCIWVIRCHVNLMSKFITVETLLRGLSSVSAMFYGLSIKLQRT